MLDPVRPKGRHKFKMAQIRKDINMISILMIMMVTIAGNVQFTDAICDKTPEKMLTLMPKMSGNNGFAIGIVGSPRLYRPGQKYTITLEGTEEDGNEKPRFTNFMLAAEPVSTSPAHFTPMGKMEIRPGDPMVMYSDRCRNSIKESSSSMKDAISVSWTAPSEHDLKDAPHGSSGCLEFRAMVIARQDFWYMNTGALTYEMCKDTSFKPPGITEPTIEPCNACTEAKYELIFEGIWSRHTHPKDFPVDEWRTQFSKLIGASHSNPNQLPNGHPKSNGYSLWSYSKPASPALEALATHGMTRRLEHQMKGYSKDIRSVIKARGLEQRSNVAGQTFAVFRVDPIHHLLTFVTKMIPSPDWIVGVSNENLCLPNGSWTDHRTIDLYPADAGVDSGLKYNAPKLPTQPRDNVKRITSSDPDNPDSPFWDEHRAPMKPVARLHIIKQREYRKNRCPQGRGPQTRNRGIVNPIIDYNPNIGGGGSGDGGDTYVAQQGPGIGPRSNEDSYPEYGGNDHQAISPVSDDYDNNYDSEDNYRQNPPLFADDPCMTTDWSFWSECSQTCGKAGNSQNRRRQFMDIGEANTNQCGQTIKLTDKQPCRHLQDCPAKRYVSGNTFNPFPNGNDNNMRAHGFSSNWERRGIESGAQRQVVPGRRQSYVYPSASNNDVEMNREIMYGRERGNGRNRGNIGRGMYGYGSNSPRNQEYQRPVSYEYGGGVRGSQADEVSHDLPEQARYQGRPQGDGSSATVEQTCDVSLWGEWSECSSECDTGVKTRSRHYISQRNLTSGNCGEELSQRIDCVGNGINCPSWQQPNVVRSGFGAGAYGFTRQPEIYSKVEEPAADCATAEWSEWSPCSDKCSQGTKRRTRLYYKAFVDYPRSCEVQLIESEICWGDTGGIGCQDTYSSSNYDQISYRNDQNYNYNVEIEPLEDENQLYPNQIMSQVDKCSLDMNHGAARCVSHYTRWYYDRVDGQCKEFVYKGCGGNQNNFESKELCMRSCSEEQVIGSLEQNEDIEENTMRTLDYNSDNNGLVSDNLIRLTQEEENSGVFYPPRMGRPPKPIDCQASAWSEWSACSKTCGSGWTTRDRDILVNAGPGGRPCPRKLHRKRKCRLMPCPADTKYWYQGSWRHIGQD